MGGANRGLTAHHNPVYIAPSSKAEPPPRRPSRATNPLHATRGPAPATVLDIVPRGSLPYVSDARRSIQRRTSPFGEATGGPGRAWLVPCARSSSLRGARGHAMGWDPPYDPRGWHSHLRPPVEGSDVPQPTRGEIRVTNSRTSCPGRHSGVRSCYWEWLASSGLAAALGRLYMASCGT